MLVKLVITVLYAAVVVVMHTLHGIDPHTVYFNRNYEQSQCVDWKSGKRIYKNENKTTTTNPSGKSCRILLRRHGRDNYP